MNLKRGDIVALFIPGQVMEVGPANSAYNAKVTFASTDEAQELEHTEWISSDGRRFLNEVQTIFKIYDNKRMEMSGQLYDAITILLPVSEKTEQ